MIIQVPKIIHNISIGNKPIDPNANINNFCQNVTGCNNNHTGININIGNNNIINPKIMRGNLYNMFIVLLS